MEKAGRVTGASGKHHERIKKESIGVGLSVHLQLVKTSSSTLNSRSTKQAGTQRCKAAAPILTLALTFLLGFDLFAVFKPANGGHSLAVPCLLSKGKFCPAVTSKSPSRG